MRRTRPDAVELVYVDSAGNEHQQPLEDVTAVGTLIDPETGDDMELVGVVVPEDDHELDDLLALNLEYTDDLVDEIIKELNGE